MLILKFKIDVAKVTAIRLNTTAFFLRFILAPFHGCIKRNITEFATTIMQMNLHTYAQKSI